MMQINRKMRIPGQLKCSFAVVCCLLIGSRVAFSQECSDQPLEVSVLIQMVKTEDPTLILKAAAIGGDAVAPAIRPLAKAGMPLNTSEAAAQIALARLGDIDAIQQLERELNQNRRNINAIRKLARVADNKAVFILMDYLVKNRFNQNRILDYSDTYEDPLFYVVQALMQILPNPPVWKASTLPESLSIWTEWWVKNKNIPQFREVSREVSGRRLQCLVREVEWGFPEAIFEIASVGETSSMPLLRTFTEFGDKSASVAPLFTTRGNAQTALAKLGDSNELAKILEELHSPEYRDAVRKLQYIGGQVAVAAIIDSLEQYGFLNQLKPPRPVPLPFEQQQYDQAVEEYIRTLLQALPSLVQNPPLPETAAPTKANIRVWKDWWIKNREGFRRPGVPSL